MIQFIAKRVKKFNTTPNQPDYNAIVEVNGVHYSLVGWLKPTSSDLSFKLEEITSERLDKDKYLRSRFADYLSLHKKKGLGN